MGGVRINHEKYNKSQTNWDISILLEDLWFVETSPPTHHGDTDTPVHTHTHAHTYASINYKCLTPVDGVCVELYRPTVIY